MKTPHETTRRAVIGALAIAPVVGVPAAAGEAADPIFAAIENCKRTASAYIAVCEFTDHILAREEGPVVTAEGEADCDAAAAAEDEAMTALYATMPTTKAGARAALAYLAERDDAWPGALADFATTLIASPVLAP